MKTPSFLTVVLCTLALFGTTSALRAAEGEKTDKKACCEATAEAGKKCPHPCCVKAAEAGTVCEKCHKKG